MARNKVIIQSGDLEALVEVANDQLEYLEQAISEDVNAQGEYDSLAKVVKRVQIDSEESKDFFEVLSVHRNDLVDYSTIDPKQFTDDEMTELAKVIDESIMASGIFWEAIRTWLEDRKQLKERE